MNNHFRQELRAQMNRLSVSKYSLSLRSKQFNQMEDKQEYAIVSMMLENLIKFTK